MGKGGQRAFGNSQIYTWEDVQKHNKKEDKWLVIDGEVYDITEWSKRHPGGPRVISHYAGQDASEAFAAFHNDENFVRKYMKTIHIGKLDNPKLLEEGDEAVKKDMAELRETAKNMGLFKPSIFFYITNVGHLLFFEALAYLVLKYFGIGWIPWILSVAFYSIVQAQGGWSQHDFGHLSVFKSTRLNHLMHSFVMNFTKGASADWWNWLHYQHHAKPNVLNKDPDVRLDALFCLGEEMPKKIAKEKRNNIINLPWNWQHKYFFATLPPLLFPVYFQVMIFRHAISRKKWFDLFTMCTFYAKILYLYSPLLGVWGAIGHYFLVRCIESHWFVWVAQSNHIPMEINEDKARPWVPLQLYATCNVEKGVFNDWFTGHLNFQIEHHIFPTMPRHNLYKIQPLVMSLCKKHNIPYQVKSLGTAFADIYRSLKHSGELWQHYYEAYHHA